jgi:CheY-like chemotaxis protein
MKKKLTSILLIDDDPDDNYYHQIILNKMNIVDKVEVAGNGLEAIAYLTSKGVEQPDLIFLDLNMPKMNGWEFLEEYKNLNLDQKAKVLIVILSTSANPDDIKRSHAIHEVTGFETKPLSEEILNEILQRHFKEHL